MKSLTKDALFLNNVNYISLMIENKRLLGGEIFNTHGLKHLVFLR